MKAFYWYLFDVYDPGRRRPYTKKGEWFNEKTTLGKATFYMPLNVCKFDCRKKKEGMV